MENKHFQHYPKAFFNAGLVNDSFVILISFFFVKIFPLRQIERVNELYISYEEEEDLFQTEKCFFNSKRKENIYC
jgi:hypothetical protein